MMVKNSEKKNEEEENKKKKQRGERKGKEWKGKGRTSGQPGPTPDGCVIRVSNASLRNR